MVRSFQIWCLTQFFLFPIRVRAIKMITEKSFMFKDAEFIFCGSFSISGKIWSLMMKITPLVPHVFSSFLFYQELRPFKTYRTFRFKFPDKKLMYLRQFTIPPLECRWFLKICSFSFFRIRSAIAQQISSCFRRYKTTLGVWIGVELDVQL